MSDFIYHKVRQQVIDAVPLSKYLRDAGYDAEDGKGVISCPNPLHEDGTPSFRYDDDLKVCNCFGCDLKGTVVELNYQIKHAEHPNVNYTGSLKALCAKYSIAFTPDTVIKGQPNFRHGADWKPKYNDNLYLGQILQINQQVSDIHGVDYHEKLPYYRLVDAVLLGDTTPRNGYRQLKSLG